MGMAASAGTGGVAGTDGTGGIAATGGNGAGGASGMGGGGVVGSGGFGGGDPVNCGRADTAALASARHTNEDGESFTGRSAVDAISNDCVIGASTLSSQGCFDALTDVLSDNTQVTRAVTRRLR